MASTPVYLTIVYIRRVMALAGLGGTLAGAVTWIAGWQYGHTLTTLGLLITVIRWDFMDALRPELGVLHTGYVQIYRDRSDPEEALKSAGVAVRHFRKHAAKHPAENSRLAWALETQSDLLTEQGKHEDALAVDRETVEIWRRAVAIDKGYTFHLSRSLNRIALTLGRLDRDAESIPHTTESIALTRQLVAWHEGSLALLLSNLTISLIDAEEWDRALPVAGEAWEIRCRLAATAPELCDVAVGDANQLRKILNQLERPAEILRVSEEVVEHERTLLADDPARLPEFADAVLRLGNSLVAEDRVPEGKARLYESLELQRRFSENYDDGRSGYAAACEKVGHSLGAIRHDEEALAVFREGLAVRRALAASDTRHHEQLVRALAGAALRLKWSEQPELARQFATEGLALYREHPDSSGPPQVQQVLQELAEDPAPGAAQES